MPYTLKQKIQALDCVARHGGDLAQAQAEVNIPRATLKKWQRQADAIYTDYHAHLQRESQHKMVRAQFHLAEKTLDLVNALTPELIANAPLNQIATALNAVTDRYIKLSQLTHPENDERQVITVEFKTDDTISASPPWADASDNEPRALQSGELRATMGQDGTREDDAGSERAPIRHENRVVRPNLSNRGDRMAQSANATGTSGYRLD